MACLSLVLCPCLSSSYRSSIYSRSLPINPSSRDTSPIRSVTLPFSPPSSTLKTSYISKSSTRGVVFLTSILWPSLLIMPRASLSALAVHHNRIILTILLLGEIMSPCARCSEKGLVCVIITSLTGR